MQEVDGKLEFSMHDIMYVRDPNFSPRRAGWCTTCKWANLSQDGYVLCLFVPGSCARIDGSIENPIKNAQTSERLQSEWEARRSAYRLLKLEEIRSKMREISSKFRDECSENGDSQ